jgi:hypothetical protein
MKNTNWRAMQISGSLVMRNKHEQHPNPPKDVSISAMTMGSFKATLSKGGVFANRSRGKPGISKLAKRKIFLPPKEGWNASNLGGSYRHK